MFDISAYISKLSALFVLSPLFTIAVLVVTALFLWWGIHRLRYRKDPYFPLKPSEKVVVVLSEKTPTGLTLVDVVDGKWGPMGLYIPLLDRIYRNIQFISGRKKLVHLTKGADGVFKPAGLGMVEVGANTEVQSTVIDGVEVKEEKKTIKKEIIKPDNLTEEEKKTLLMFLTPTVEEYLLTMDSYTDTIFALAKEKVLKNMNPSHQGFFSQIFRGVDPDKAYLFAVIIVSVILFLIASSAISQMANVAIEIAKQSAKVGMGG